MLDRVSHDLKRLSHRIGTASGAIGAFGNAVGRDRLPIDRIGDFLRDGGDVCNGLAGTFNSFDRTLRGFLNQRD